MSNPQFHLEGDVLPYHLLDGTEGYSLKGTTLLLLLTTTVSLANDYYQYVYIGSMICHNSTDDHQYSLALRQSSVLDLSGRFE